jgi:AcrR family transcriptional regulator
MRMRIVEAARVVFREKGFASARMDDIAWRAGVAVGTIYLYFRTKEAICEALADRLNRRMLVESLPLLSAATAAQGIADAVSAAFRILREECDLLAILYLHIGFGPFENQFQHPSEIDQELFGALAEAYARRMDVGEYRRYDVAKAVHMTVNLIERTAVDCLLLGAGDLQDYENTVVLFLQNALLEPRDDRR